MTPLPPTSCKSNDLAEKKTLRTLLVLLLLAVLTGLSAVACGGGGGVLHRDDYGAEWPLTVDEATLGCYGGSELPAPYFEVDSVRYPMTGWAETILSQRGFEIRPLQRIWRDDPEVRGAKVNIGPWIDRGSELC